MNERTRILNMIAEGKITVEEGEKLLDSLAAPESGENPAVELKDKRGRRPKKLRVHIDSKEDSKKAKVNVTIPLSVVRTFGPIIAKNLPREAREEMSRSGIDFAQLIDDIENIIAENDGEDIVNIDTEGEDAAKVRIYLE